VSRSNSTVNRHMRQHTLDTCISRDFVIYDVLNGGTCLHLARWWKLIDACASCSLEAWLQRHPIAGVADI
jgi:hypothetical protein